MRWLFECLCIENLFFHFLYNGFKSLGLVHGQVGKGFAVKLHTRFVELVNELAVRNTVLANRSVNTLDPDSAVNAFFVFTAYECVS